MSRRIYEAMTARVETDPADRLPALDLAGMVWALLNAPTNDIEIAVRRALREYAERTLRGRPAWLEGVTKDLWIAHVRSEEALLLAGGPASCELVEVANDLVLALSSCRPLTWLDAAALPLLWAAPSIAEFAEPVVGRVATVLGITSHVVLGAPCLRGQRRGYRPEAAADGRVALGAIYGHLVAARPELKLARP